MCGVYLIGSIGQLYIKTKTALSVEEFIKQTLLIVPSSYFACS